MLVIDQGGVFGFGFSYPLASHLDSTSVLSDGDNLEVFAFELLIKSLPAWQIETAPSPRCPRYEQNFLAAKIPEGVFLTVHIGQREIRRFESGEVLATRVGSRAEVPHAILFIPCHRLMSEFGKRGQVEKSRATLFRDEFCFPIFGDRKTKLVAAYSLRLDDKSGRSPEVGGRHPQVGRLNRCLSDLGSPAIIYDHSASSFGCGNYCRNQTDYRCA
jgi:hypothetical protein